MKKAVQVCGVEKVFASGDERNVLSGVVDHDCQMIAGRHLLTRQHHITKHLWSGHLITGSQVPPGKLAATTQRFLHVEPPCMRLSGCDSGIPFRPTQAPTAAWV